ncbi:MAG: DUF4440 domain-containing protein [Gemmatimonadota bacterium]
MRVRGIRSLFPAIAVALAVAAPAHAQESESESGLAAAPNPALDSVRATVEAFKQALRSGDAEGALALLHSEVLVYEAGHAETRDEYAEGHLAADISFLQAVESTTTQERVNLSGDMALYASEYASKGEFRGRDIDSNGTETIVLVRSDDDWKILHIHWSSR